MLIVNGGMDVTVRGFWVPVLIFDITGDENKRIHEATFLEYLFGK